MFSIQRISPEIIIKFIILKGTELFPWFLMCLFLSSSLSMFEFHCVPKLNSENTHKGQDLQLNSPASQPTEVTICASPTQKEIFVLKKIYNFSVFCFQGVLCHLASFYAQYQMYSIHVGIPVAISQTSTYNGTVTQQCSNQILMDEFWNSKIHLSTPIIWNSGNRWSKCIFVSWK